MRLLVFSDVHGNTPALRALFDRFDELQPDVLVNLGDIASGGCDPRGTLDLLATRPDTVTIRGNHERQVLGDELAPGGSDWLAAQAMREDDRAWFESLPTRATPAPGVLAYHATPDDDLTYLLETVDASAPNGLREATEDEILQRLGSWVDKAKVFLGGHTHLQRIRPLSNGILVVNPGSLGWPAFPGDEPTPHLVEAGSPEARFVVPDEDTSEPSGWRATPHVLPYPVEEAVEFAVANGRPDVAHALRTGRSLQRLSS